MHATTAHPPTQARKPKKTRTFRIVQRPTPEEVAIVAITINGDALLKPPGLRTFWADEVRRIPLESATL
jgi:hypothetical protein